MKIIDLLNKVANGEEVPKKIIINGWCYKFEWQDYAGNYLDESEEIDLMSALSCDKEELNKEVEILDDEDEEKGLPEKINNWTSAVGVVNDSNIEEYVHKLFEQQTQLYFKVNSIIDYLEKQGKGE